MAFAAASNWPCASPSCVSTSRVFALASSSRWAVIWCFSFSLWNCASASARRASSWA
ncbi:MAG: hypothetical protein SFW67_23495 [Myxococcaceae bacterium]|nr:hypothetical protein [Myxococcaceae bacterium]